jgi:hypothetical protein
MFQGPLPILHLLFQGPLHILHVLFQGPLSEQAVWTNRQRPRAEDVMFQSPLPILHLLFRGPLHVLHVLFQGPLHVLHVLFQAPLGERAVRTDRQGLEWRSGMFQGHCLFYIYYSRAYLVSEQFGPRDMG